MEDVKNEKKESGKKAESKKVDFGKKGAESTHMPGEKELQKLLEGNRRFIDGKTKPDLSAQRRMELKKGQNPFAAILSCSDSRIETAHIFDGGLGELFIIRNAGNILTPVALGSIEYAVKHAGVKLVLVLGHEHCGAITATVNEADEGPNIAAIANEIKPSVEKAKKLGTCTTKDELVEETCNEHIVLMVEHLKSRSPILRGMHEAREIKIIGAKYFHESGEVEIVA